MTSEYANDTAELTAAINRLEIVIQEAAESICDAIDSLANRMCSRPNVDAVDLDELVERLDPRCPKCRGYGHFGGELCSVCVGTGMAN